uniref:Putative secreted protein n=1 Tax=Hemileia vastatrix TaxID=203904 RepID=T1UNX7_9BASI|nr:putative secreted protein [Hemileia vastatrix]
MIFSALLLLTASIGRVRAGKKFVLQCGHVLTFADFNGDDGQKALSPLVLALDNHTMLTPTVLQPDGKAIPWGTGKLLGGSGNSSLSSSNTTATTTSQPLTNSTVATDSKGNGTTTSVGATTQATNKSATAPDSTSSLDTPVTAKNTSFGKGNGPIATGASTANTTSTSNTTNTGDSSSMSSLLTQRSTAAFITLISILFFLL